MNENGKAVTTSFSANEIVTNWLRIMMLQDGKGISEFVRDLIISEWKRRNQPPNHLTTDREI